MRAFRLVLSALFCMAVSLTPGYSDAVLADFADTPVGQTPRGWKLRGTNGHASRFTVQETPGEEGEKHCAVLDYDFAAERRPGGWIGKQGRKTVIMGCWLRIPDDHWVLEIDVEGDACGHGLVVSVGEPNREWFNYDLGRVDFTGPKTLKVDLRTDWRDSAGPQPNQQLEPPLWMASFNLEESFDGPRTGKLVVHLIRALEEDPKGLSALSPRWLLPEGDMFTVGETAAVRIALQNLSGEDLSGKTLWHLGSQGQAVLKQEGAFNLPAQAEAEIALPLLDLPVGYYEADLTLTTDEESRTLRNSFAVLPPPGPDPLRRLGLGAEYLPRTDPDSCALLVDTMQRLGASWTMAILDFTAFEDTEASEQAAQQRAILEAACHRGLDLWASLGNLPKDLARYSSERQGLVATNPEQLAKRYEAALTSAADLLRGDTCSWVIRWLDTAFMPERAEDAPPDSDYAEFLERRLATLREANPDARLIASLNTPSLEQWPQRAGELAWPEGVGLFTDDLMLAINERGGIRQHAEDLAQRLAAAGIEADLWLQIRARPVESAEWAPPRAFAEGVVLTLTEAVYALPRAHLLYVPLRGRTPLEALLTADGSVTPPGVAFTICARLLNGTEPEREVNQPDCHGYLFRCEGESLAILWSQPLDAEVVLPLQTQAAVAHYGALQQYPDLPADATEVLLHPGANLLRGNFTLGAK